MAERCSAWLHLRGRGDSPVPDPSSSSPVKDEKWQLHVASQQLPATFSLQQDAGSKQSYPEQNCTSNPGQHVVQDLVLVDDSLLQCKGDVPPEHKQSCDPHSSSSQHCTLAVPGKAPRITYPRRAPLFIACTIITIWCLLQHHLLFHYALSCSQWYSTAALFLLAEYVYTGLFVTGHDAWHGSISTNRWLNNAVGRVAMILFGWFDFDRMRQLHWQHHNHAGIIGQDPDFNSGNPNLLRWFVGLGLEYTTVPQVCTIVLQTGLLWLGLGVPLENIIVFCFLPMGLSTFRLFYFLTYVPHMPRRAYYDSPWQLTRSSDAPAWLALLQCFNAVYHLEHHRWPYLPWFVLPAARAAVKSQ